MQEAEVLSTATAIRSASLNKNARAWHLFLVFNAGMGQVKRCKRGVRCVQKILCDRLISLITAVILIPQTSTISGAIQ